MEKCAKDKKEIEVNFFDKISNIIKFLRINAVNIILQIEKIREKCSYCELKGKYILNNANKSYLYDENYLVNMPNNIKFINKSILFNYIETDNHAQNTDLFFSNCKNIITDDNKKLKIPISIELKNAINKCKYLILQDNLLNNIKNDNLMTINRNKFYPKKIGIKNSYNSYNSNNFMPSSTIKKLNKCNSELSLLNRDDSRKFMTMFGHNKVNLSRTLYYLKKTMGNDYENLFLSSNKNRKLDMKQSEEIMDKYFHLHKQINEDENNIINNSNNNKVILENKIDEENNFTNKTNNNKNNIENIYNNKYDINDKNSNRSNEMNINKYKKEKEKNKRKKVSNKSKNKNSKSKKKEMNDKDNNKELNNNNNSINENEREDDKYNNYDLEKNNNDKKNEEMIDLNNNNNNEISNNNDNDINKNLSNNNDINNENEKLIEKERINEENKESENDNSDNIKKDNNISEINEDENENKKKENNKNEMRDDVYSEKDKIINNREKMENRTNKSNQSIGSKGLIKFKKYTEEEIKKLNDDEDDDEEEDEK